MNLTGIAGNAEKEIRDLFEENSWISVASAGSARYIFLVAAMPRGVLCGWVLTKPRTNKEEP
jgi:hypothetical protein